MRLPRSLAASALGLALAACAALIDIKDLRPPDADASAGDASTIPADAGPLDGAGGDASRCPPPDAETFVQVTTPTLVTGDAERVYFTSVVHGGTSRILSCARCGCAGGPREVTSGSFEPFALVVDGEYLWWTDSSEVSGALHRTKTTGSDDVSIQLAVPTGLAVDATHVYFATIGGVDGGVVGNGIWRIAKNAFPGAPERLEGSAIAPFSVAVDATHVYWSTAVGLDMTGGFVRTLACVGNLRDDVRRVPKGGGAAETLASGERCSVALALDDSDVYYTTLATAATEEGQVRRVAKGGGDASTIAARQLGPLGLAVAEGALHWTTAVTPGAVRRCRLPACSPPDDFATGESAPSAVFVDRTTVYWANQGLGGGSAGVRWRAR